jgi:hypothetical protein
MREANLRASNGKTSAADVARWLGEQISSKSPR